MVNLFIIILLITLTSGCTASGVSTLGLSSALSEKPAPFTRSIVFADQNISGKSSKLIFYRYNSRAPAANAKAIILYDKNGKIAAMPNGSKTVIKLIPGHYIFSLKTTENIRMSCLEDIECMKKYSGREIDNLPPESKWYKIYADPLEAEFKAGEIYYIYYEPHFGPRKDIFTFVKENFEKIFFDRIARDKEIEDMDI